MRVLAPASGGGQHSFLTPTPLVLRAGEVDVSHGDSAAKGRNGRCAKAGGSPSRLRCTISKSRSTAAILGSMGLAISTLGAILATLLGVWVGNLLGSRSQQQQWSRDRQADACAQVLRESSNVVLALERLHVERRNPEDEGALLPHGIDFAAWNDALSMVGLVADHDVAEAARTIDSKIWPAHLQVNRGWASDDDWFRLRNSIDAMRVDFVNIARKRFAAPGPPLRNLTGRPPADDPIWELRRSHFSASLSPTPTSEDGDSPALQ